MLPTGPGVCGHGILIEEALFTLFADVGKHSVSKNFLYQRGILSLDNRTGGTRVEEQAQRTQGTKG